MCGICGFLDLKQRITSEILLNMNNVAKYRGPDDEGYMLVSPDNSIISCKGNDTISDLNQLPFLENDVSFNGIIGMGHRRLSIIDLSVLGHQPMVSKDNEIVITLNGEIYNYIELKEELANMGCKFHTDSDTEVVIEAYKIWGEDCVKKFNGMWSFVIYDRKEKKLFCSRDRMGVKPFHYYFDSNCFIFASELKQIIQVPFLKRKLNKQVFSTNVIFNLSDYNDETLIQDIYTLKPAHNLVISLEKDNLEKRETCYWKLKVNTHGNEKDNFSARLGEKIENSILYRMRSDIPIGGLLSGGLDSSSLLTLVRRMYPDYSFETFTASYENGGEQKYAQIINQYNKFNSNYVYPKCDDLKSNLENIVWHCEGLVNFAHIGFYNVLKKAKEKGIHVLFNGQCGDETLFGYERYYAYYFFDLLKKRRISKMIKEFKLAVQNSAISLKMMIGFCLYFNFPDLRIEVKKRDIGRYLSRSIISNLPKRKIKELISISNLDELIYKELTETQLPHILRWDDRSYMAYSIESRVPFLDYEYIEYAVNIPAGDKIKNGYTKNILREYMDGKMPKEVVWRKNKMGFSASDELWSEQLTEDFFEFYFNDPICDRLFSVKKLRKLMKKNINSSILKVAVVMTIFVKKFGVDIG